MNKHIYYSLPAAIAGGHGVHFPAKQQEEKETFEEEIERDTIMADLTSKWG